MTRSLALAALLLTSCANKEPIGSEDSEYAWPGGMFTMSTTGVSDACTDGAFNSVLLPDGAGTTNEWQYAIEIPSWEELELPQTYEISLQDPFAPMEVTVRRGSAEGELEMNGGEQQGVALDEDNDDCLIEMSIAADIVLDTDSSIHGIATLTLLDRPSQTCPSYAPPCDIDLDFTGVSASGG